MMFMYLGVKANLITFKTSNVLNPAAVSEDEPV